MRALMSSLEEWLMDKVESLTTKTHADQWVGGADHVAIRATGHHGVAWLHGPAGLALLSGSKRK